jgi:hypothetical protein
MLQPRCAPHHAAAILSLHSHSDRSFLDDRELALLSGALRDDGIANDLVVAVITRDMEADGRASEVERRLVETLAAYDPIVYERVWDAQLVARLREALADKTFIGLRGEHELLETAPADIYCDGDPKQLLAPLLQWLRGERPHPPAGVLLRDAGAAGGAASWAKPESPSDVPPRRIRYAPNLRPVVVNPESLPPVRTFSVMGNDGCPFQLDARDNPLYAGTNIPDGYGRGCAFCVTGNHYDGRPNAETAASVLEQIRYVRANAPEYRLLVLKDQNPFGYLTEVVEHCEAESLYGFTLLLETRAEWFLRNAQRFDRALAVARRSGVRLAPFLVGIENFSQPELDRFNKGITVATNIEFLETLWQWKARYGEALDLGHAAFGFILFTPWTTLPDLEANLAAIERTRFDRLRGSVLLSRARLYPDTALYYLAERDGVLADDYDSAAHDASRRYGYYPSRPWRHLHADVAHFAALATQLAERNDSRDMVSIFRVLLEAFRAAGPGWSAITVGDVWDRYQEIPVRSHDRAADPTMVPATDAFQRRFARLVHPLSLDQTFAGGWRFGQLSTRPGRVEVELTHEIEPPLLVEIVPRQRRGAHFRRSRHYDIRTAARECTSAQHAALTVLSEAIADNDR